MSIERGDVVEVKPDIEDQDVTENRPSISRFDVVADIGGGSVQTPPSTGMVMKSDATSAVAYVQKDWGSDIDGIWVTFGLAFTSDSLANWVSNGFPNWMVVSDSSDDLILTLNGFTDLSWQYISQSTFCSSMSPTMVGNTWRLFECHMIGSTGVGEIYIDGSLICSLSGSAQPLNRKLLMGQDNFDGSVAIVYIRNVTVGTSRGGSNVFKDDFSSGNLSLWDSVTGACSVIPDPFP